MVFLNPKASENTSSKSSGKSALRWNRLIHRWLSIAISIPILFIILTGIFLQLRKPVDWIQPPTLKGSQSYDPTISLEQVLTQVKSVPEMNVNDWQDIKLLDMRPKKGIIKVRNYNELETQVDASTGDILQTAQRRNDFVVKMHEFSAWHARLWLGLPVRLGFLAIFLTGVYLTFKLTIMRFRIGGLKGVFNIRSKKAAKPKDSANVSSVNSSVNLSSTTPSTASATGLSTNNVIFSPTQSSSTTGTVKAKRPWRLRLKSWMLKYHYWLGWVVIIPWAFVIGSGLLLQVRYEVPWVMPTVQQGQGTVPEVEFVQVLDTARQMPEYGVENWKDVWRVYVYPNKGITTIRAKNRQEFQIDSTTGEVLQVAIRRTDWLEDIHEGKWHKLNLWLFLPVHVLSLFLWVTGAVVAYSR
ncbi:PepSY-associated TM helix domain-containing protein [Moorena producens JHB]|uniref:PepSY-associated TM helix domain-containing protein n=1 Tax=Moorena producens (strain JHB) TaxID=1454205 RepID=A0A1D9G7X2_MOOP1|nr:PepSY-associated TM helix domain-containing protein [Moorena producens]AOY83732.1 PepSY-associated TM helix domain-containing protein [Moorena producens JHB]